MLTFSFNELINQDKETIKDYIAKNDTSMKPLKYSCMPEPHGEVAVISGYDKRILNRIERFADLYGLVCTNAGNGILTVSKHKPFATSDGFQNLFTGFAFCGKKFCFGKVGAEVYIDYLLSEEAVYGQYGLIRIKRNRIELSSDYTGMVPLYYYNEKNVFAACNSYHLLLLILSASGIELSMDIDRSLVNLSTTSNTFNYVFAQEMDVKGCNVNMPWEKLIYSQESGLIIEKTSLYTDVFTKEDWDEDIYEEYLLKAKEDVYNNVYAIFDYEKFETVVCDLSGGFDSRVAYAAACNMPKRLRKKMKVRTYESHVSDDMKKAAGVQNIYNYEQFAYYCDDITDIFDENGYVDIAVQSRSLGIYYFPADYNHGYFLGDNIVNISGYQGEVFLGYYRTRGSFDFSDTDKLIDNLGSGIIKGFKLDHILEMKNKAISDVLSGFEYDEMSKKFNIHFLCFANRTHFAARNMMTPMLTCGIMASKYLMKAKWMYFNKFKNNIIPREKLSVDFTALINPLIAVMPYASVNEKQLPIPSDLLIPVNVQFVSDETLKKPVYINTPPEKTYNTKCSEYIMDFGNIKKALCNIYTYSDSYHEIIDDYWILIDRFENDPKYMKDERAVPLIRKIWDIYYQICICKSH